MTKKIFMLFILLFSYGKILALTEFSALSYTLYSNHTAEVTRPKSTGNYSFSTPTKVIIPETVTYNDEVYTVVRIGEKAFLSQSNLYEVEIPESVTSIGNSAFYASHLTSLIIPNDVTQIEGYAFEYCSHLTSVSIGTNLKSIGNMAFTGCDSITTVTWNAKNGASINFGNQVEDVSFGNQVEVIPSNLCSGMTLLSSVTLPQKLKKIGSGAFSNCSGLTSIIIPDSVTNIGNNSFSNCTGLTSIIIPEKVTNIGSGAFSSCTGLTSVTINSVVDIGNNSFSNCTGITSIILPDNLTNIGDEAFSNCNSISPSIIIPASVSSIGKRAFFNCTGLTSIIIEGSPRLSTWSFAGCINLQGIYCLSDTPPIVNAEINCLYNTNGCPIYCPCGQYNAYRYIFSLYLDRLSENPECIYTVTFKDWNGTVLKTEQVEKGKSATAPANPTRDGYTFTGWDKDFSNVQSDLIVTAQYTQNTPSITYYTVTFKDWNGTVLKTEQVEEGKSATAPANPTRDGYTFIGWDKDFSNVQSDLIVTAQYKQNTPSTTYYTVTFKDWDGTVLKTQQVEKGKSATAPANPTRDGYTFVGWDTSFANVQSDLIVTAIYQKNQTPVTNAIKVRLDPYSTYGTYGWDEVYLWAWTDGGNIFSEWPGQRIDIDADGWYSYTFTQDISNVNIIWNNGLGAQTIDITGITESTCFALDDVWGTQITVRIIDCPTSVVYYNVFFKDWDGTVLKTQQVEKGKSATAPANPTRDGYTFTGWDKDFSNVQSDLIVTALYTQNTVYYTVTFKDWNGTVLKTQQVEKGKSAAAPANPTRDGYTFTGWDKDFSNVQSDLIVTAQYRKNETPAEAITVRLQALSATSWSKVNLYYWADGVDGPAWPGITLSKDAQGWYGYTFDSSVKLVNIIWNNGSGDQTVDITDITESTCYKLNSTTGQGITVSLLECEAEAIEDIHVEGDKPVKVLHNDQIYILRGEKIYTLQGQEVR